MFLEASSICIVDSAGKIVKEAKVLSEPEDLIAWFKVLPFALARIGLEAGPLSQWLYVGLKGAGFAVELLETRHVRDAFKAIPVKTDRNDVRGSRIKELTEITRPWCGSQPTARKSPPHRRLRTCERASCFRRWT